MNRSCLALILAFCSACIAHAQQAPSFPTTELELIAMFEIKLYTLKKYNCTEAVKLLTPQFREVGVDFKVDERSNSVVVRALSQQQHMLEAVFEQLDSLETKPAPKLPLKVYKINYGKASDYVNIVKSLVSGHLDESRTQISLQAPFNAIMVQSSPEIHEEIEKVIAQFDQPKSPSIKATSESVLFELYWIGNAEGETPLPADIANTLSTMHQHRGDTSPVNWGKTSATCYLDVTQGGGMVSLEQVQVAGQATLDCHAKIVPLEDDSYKVELALSSNSTTKTTVQVRQNQPAFVAASTTANETDRPKCFVLKLSREKMPPVPRY